MKKKIFFITGSRAEYGQFSYLLKKLQANKRFDFKLIVTGMHLYPKFGRTYKQILRDGVKIYKKINLNYEKDHILSQPISLSNGINKFSKLFSKDKPDLVLIPCDRYEMLAPALSCHFLNIPIVHFYGGEISEGSIDNIHRNTLSILSKYHFVSHDQHMQNLIKIRIEKKKIFNIGILALEKINNTNFLKKEVLEKKIKVRLTENTILCTFHPVANSLKKTINEIENILKAFNKLKNYNFIFTKPNNDYGNSEIIKRVEDFVNKNKKRSVLTASLGQQKYYSLIKLVKFVSGNSSSLLYEVPIFNKFSLNIGIRQNGRLKGKTVINCKSNVEQILNSIKKIEYKITKKNIFNNIFYKKNSSNIVIKKLETFIKNK